MKHKVFFPSVILAVMAVMVSCSKSSETNWHSTFFNISGTTVQLRYEIPLQSQSTIHCLSKAKSPEHAIEIFFDSVLKVVVDEGHCNKTFETDNNPHIIRAISNGDTLFSTISMYGSHPLYFSSDDKQTLNSMTIGKQYGCSCSHSRYMGGCCVYRLSKEGVCTAKLVNDHLQVLAIAPGSCELQISPDSTFDVSYDVCTIYIK